MVWQTQALQGADIQWKWKDEAWAESHDQFNAFWSVDGQAPFVPVVGPVTQTAGIGVHQSSPETPTRTLSWTTAPGVTNAVQHACGHPYYTNRSYGEWTCMTSGLISGDDIRGW
jgi:hypothetical protein